MCGILGVINFNGPACDRKTIIEMSDSLGHRGPDSEGYLFAGRKTGLHKLFRTKDELLRCNSGDISRMDICFAHRRLSILDLETGDQPISNEDGTVWLVFNGQIYNHKDIRRELESKGHKFITHHSDTEVIVHAWEEWGKDCLEKFNGMFAFGIIDLKKRQLFLARDRVGIKPLYLYSNGGRIIFSSELRSIIRDASVPRILDSSALGQYFKYGYVPSPSAIFRNFCKIKPAHFILTSIEPGGIDLNQRPYWDLDFSPDHSVGEQEWLERLQQQLAESVKMQMISDVPLGLLLSGGIDSSLVALYMSKAGLGRIKTFSIGFEDKRYDETPYAETAAARFGTEHRQEVLTKDSIEIFPKIVSYFDEPFADQSAIPTYYISRLARRHVTVALSGDGGDEAFGGYERYIKAVRYRQTIDVIPALLRKILLGPLDKIMPDYIKGKGFIRRAVLDPEQRYQYLLTQTYCSGIFSDTFRQSMIGSGGIDLHRAYWRSQAGHDYLALMQYTDTKMYLPDDILTKVDRASMAVSLEVRVPLLDHKVLELACKIPSSMKLKGSVNKYILKKILAAHFSDKFINRKKMGFGVPLADWFRGDWSEFVRDAMDIDTGGIFDKKYLKTMIKSHQHGLRNLGGTIYAVLFFKVWWKQVMGAMRG